MADGVKRTDVLDDEANSLGESDGASTLLPLLFDRSRDSGGAERPIVIVGELIAINQHAVPLVLYPGQPGTAAVAARSIVDVHGDHVGCRVLLFFESTGDSSPIVVGVLREVNTSIRPNRPENFDVEADGDRLTVTAKERLVLRCGMASITLTKEGKVLIQGTYLSSRSSGVHRIKGGSVQIN